MARDFVELQEIKRDVQSRYPHIEFPDVVLEPLWFGRRPENKVYNMFAIVDQNKLDTDLDAVFNVCSDQYQLVSHEETIWLAESAAALLPEFGTPIITPTLLAEGGQLRVKVLFPEVEYAIKPGDIVNPQSDILSSYNLKWKYSVKFGAFRLVCTNGMTVGKVFSNYKERHITSLNPENLKVTMNDGMLRYSEQTDLWMKWADTKILPETYKNVWEALPFSETEKVKIEAVREAATGLYLPDALKSGELTVWDMYNVTTQYASHDIKSEIRTVEIGSDITKAFERTFNL